MAFDGAAGSGPLQPSFEDRPGAGDRVFASLDDAEYERQVTAWTRALGAARRRTGRRAPSASPDAAERRGRERRARRARRRPSARDRADDARGDRARPGALGARPGLGRAVAGRGRRAASGSSSAPGNRRPRRRAARDRVRSASSCSPNGFDPLMFRPLDVDRRAVWRRVLVDEPRGWRPGEEPGSVGYGEDGARRARPRARDRLRRSLHRGQAPPAAARGVRGRAPADAARRRRWSSSAATRGSGRASTRPRRSIASAWTASCSRAGTTSPSCRSCWPPPTCWCCPRRARASAR